MVSPTYERQAVNTFRAIPAGAQEISERFKRFTVTNPKFLEVPGCISINELRLDGEIFPAYEDRDILYNKQGQTRPIRIALYALVPSVHGTVLVRSEQSNDGVWQVGSQVWIDGEWEDSATASTATDTAPTPSPDAAPVPAAAGKK